jgi:hypothetical protein
MGEYGSGGVFTRSGLAGRMLLVTAHTWAPPERADGPDDQPLGIEADERAEAVEGFPPVWVRVEFTGTGMQRLPGFVERTSVDRVCVQLVHIAAVSARIESDLATRLMLASARVEREAHRCEDYVFDSYADIGFDFVPGSHYSARRCFCAISPADWIGSWVLQ